CAVDVVPGMRATMCLAIPAFTRETQVDLEPGQVLPDGSPPTVGRRPSSQDQSPEYFQHDEGQQPACPQQ
ncbi:hypothetical protein B8W90_14435, partial [Staphylococcus hominis]